MTDNRFKTCKNCVSIIDVLMDRYFTDNRNSDVCYCADCALTHEHLKSFVSEVVGPAGQASKIIFKIGPGPEVENAPIKQSFVCVHCGKVHKSRSMLKLLCGDDIHFNPILVWDYSIQRDSRGVVKSYINARIGH